ncbi:hypothetical protein BJP36_43530 [Moorena producens JHB]|uniref:Uncharacterized protein n=1 Tax=Moorena producens (strain JHB) TaxID=1454205 RepID=A0A9Q9ST87_MOOP1|nr:hypothetical protein [Moorena producens]WAN69235.1 hypothetical protein BJP36_43530 [Moorena producens JHB]
MEPNSELSEHQKILGFLCYYSRLPIPDSRLPTPDSRLPIPYSRFPLPE